MFNNENLNDLAFQYKDIMESRLEKIKKISEDIKTAEILLSKTFIDTFSKEYIINDRKYLISWQRRDTCSNKRIYVDDTFGVIKPIDEMKAEFRYNCEEALVDFIESVLKNMRE